MPKVDFPLGLLGSEFLPRTKRTLQNVFNNGNGNVLTRPGITALQDTGKFARGSFQWNGFLYQVVSNSLIKITDNVTGAFQEIGTNAIAGGANIRTAIGFNTAVIVVKGGQIYTLDKSDIVVDITGNPNIVPSVDVAHINGRFVYIPASGDPAFFSNVGFAGIVEALSFFDAESLPDENNGVINYRNTLYILGTDSIEPFRDAGTSPNPFLRINGARIDNGYIGGLIEYNQTFVFLGREKEQDFGIYALASGNAIKISNEVVDLILSEHTESQRVNVITSRFKWRGYDLITFTLSNASFGFFGGNWFKLNSLVGGNTDIWGGGFITQIEGEYFTAFRNNLGKLTDIDTDYGEKINYIVEMGLEQGEGDRFSCQSIELPISQGFNAQQATVGLQMSKDGVVYGEPFFRNLGLIGQYPQILKWNLPGGLGRYREFMGWRFSSNESLVFSSEPPIVKIR